MTETDKDIVITVERREGLGKEAVRKLRQIGKIPGVVYGGNKEPFPIAVDRHSVQELLRQEAGENTIFLLKLKGAKQQRRAMIREIQIDPMTRDFIHIDFIRVTRGQKLTVSVPVELVGDCAGVRHGGVLEFSTREISMEVLPRELPEKITVDISEIDIDQNVTIEDLMDLMPKSARVLEDPGRVVVTIGAPRAAAVEEEEEAAEVAPELVITERAEPEVIGGKGKEEPE
ncbi:MAG: 50S ribosomal protein L25 [Acidobacteria bacterium]|nr:50S ribosomal protein L25 [Acidobacteriota bacterium]